MSTTSKLFLRKCARFHNANSKTTMKHLTIFVGATCVCFAAAASYEQSVKCLSVAPPALSAYRPNTLGLAVHQDYRSRYVSMSVAWSNTIGVLQSLGLGVEFKFYQYNYDDASSTGKGPAYVTGPGGFSYCDLPGCYLDSDFLSATNSSGEYSEPQVGFGVSPGSMQQWSNPQNPRVAFTRAIAGRGNKSLLKARMNVTKTVMPGIGVSGIFLCSDLPPWNIINFQDGIYSPTCLVQGSGGPSQPYQCFWK